MKLADKLVCLRKKQGLSQLKLAEIMNVSRQAISRWETGIAVPSAENLKYLGNLYNVSLDYLFDDSADELDETENTPVETKDNKRQSLKKRKTKRVLGDNFLAHKTSWAGASRYENVLRSKKYPLLMQRVFF